MKTLQTIASMCAALLMIAGCDAHIELPDKGLKVGDVMYGNGTVMPFDSAEAVRNGVIGVVFYVNHDIESNGVQGYAVTLEETPALALCDTLGVEQETSCDMEALDGSMNTFKIREKQTSDGIGSPLGSYVTENSGNKGVFIPSAKQLDILIKNRETVNLMMERCNGDFVGTDNPDCWYWTSTEVKEKATEYAWCYSMANGQLNETLKNRVYPTRTIIEVRNCDGRK